MDFGNIGEEFFGGISEKFDNFCSEVDEAINCKLLAVSAHIKEFWSEIVQDKIPEAPENVVDVIEQEITNFSDPRKPIAIVDDEKNNINMCPTSEVNIVVPDDHLRRKLSLVGNEATGMYNNSNAGNKENCIDEEEISSQKSFESTSASCIKWGTYVDTNTEATNDQQAKLSDRGVVSDYYLSMLLSLHDEKNNIDLCPTSEVNIVVPDDQFRRKLSLLENAGMGMYNNTNAGTKEICIEEAEISSLKSFESTSASYIKWGTSRHVDTNTEATNDQQAKLSDRGVVSDSLLSILLSLRKLDVSDTEDGTDLEDYAEVNEISHLDWNTVGANGPLVTEEFMYTTQSQDAKPEVYEDYVFVNTSELSSIPGLEENNGTSKMKSAEAKENKHLRNQDPKRSFAPTLPTENSVRWDEEFSEDDWVVV